MTTECSVRPNMTIHRFVAPFDRCACGQEAWGGKPPRTGLGELVSLTDAQFEVLEREQISVGIDYIFRVLGQNPGQRQARGHA